MAVWAEPKAGLEVWVSELPMRPIGLNSRWTGSPQIHQRPISALVQEGMALVHHGLPPTCAHLSLVHAGNEVHHLHLKLPQPTFWEIICICRRHGTCYHVSALYVSCVLQSTSRVHRVWHSPVVLSQQELCAHTSSCCICKSWNTHPQVHAINILLWQVVWQPSLCIRHAEQKKTPCTRK